MWHTVAGRLQELALSLSLKCLSFDFVGTSIDESSEEFGTVQVFHLVTYHFSFNFIVEGWNSLGKHNMYNNFMEKKPKPSFFYGVPLMKEMGNFLNTFLSSSFFLNKKQNFSLNKCQETKVLEHVFFTYKYFSLDLIAVVSEFWP